jgi:hypothetical protein
MRTALLVLLYMTIFSSTDDDKKEFESIQSACKLQWKSKIGNANCRSNEIISALLNQMLKVF